MSDVLAGVYSRSDAFKRKLIDALRNPGATVDQLKGRMVDDLRGAREQIGAATDEGVNYGPASRSLAMKMADAYNPVGMTKVVGPQSEALEIARKNAVKMLRLPENNTAMDRAKALGFIDDTYHGTFNRFENFDLGKANSRSQYMPGVFTADSPVKAENYGDYIMPLMQRKGTTVMDKREARRFGLPIPQVDTIHDSSAGVRVTNNLANLRSRFAAFDPARANEPDLLAGMLPLGAIALPAGGDNQGKKQARPEDIIDALRKKKD